MSECYIVRVLAMLRPRDDFALAGSASSSRRLCSRSARGAAAFLGAALLLEVAAEAVAFNAPSIRFSGSATRSCASVTSLRLGGPWATQPSGPRKGDPSTRLPSASVEIDPERPTRKEAKVKAREQGIAPAADTDNDEPLLLLLGRALVNEVLIPILKLPMVLTNQGTLTLKRINDTVTVERKNRDNYFSTETLARRWFDNVYSEGMMFLPSDLPQSLIDRNVTRVQLEPRSRFKYIEQYDVVKELGMGSSGTVYQVIDSVSGETYAVKVLHKKTLRELQYGNHNLLKNVETEIELMRRLGDHPNLLRLHEVMNSPQTGDILLRIEYCEGGQTMGFDAKLITKYASTYMMSVPPEMATWNISPLDEHKARRYFADLIAGLDYLHQNSIVHRDIKPENLLLTKDGRVKIADFGVATPFKTPGDDSITEAAGTPAFQSPEAVMASAKGCAFSGVANDIWTAGVTLYVFAHGKVPFLSLSSAQTYQMILHNTIPVDEKLSLPLRDLIFKLLDRNPATRITVEEIKNHPWMLNQ